MAGLCVYVLMRMKEPFDHAVKGHGATVLRVCVAVLGQGPDAEDVWSETFLAALRAWPEMEPDTNLEAWLVRVAQRRCIDVLRARARHAVPTDHETLDALRSRAADGSEIGPRDTGIWREVGRLPERQRLAVAYHYLGGLAHKETAELIGGNADSVRRASADGIRKLRSFYSGETTTKPAATYAEATKEDGGDTDG